jgi:hypothetical protein
MSPYTETSDSPAPWGSVIPAPRFLIEQSWWLGAELVRRHPDHVIYEMHPGGGMSDVLSVRPARELAHGDAKIMINRGGTVRVAFHRTDNSVDEVDVCHSSAPLGTQDPHAVLKALESAARLPPSTRAPASTPRSLAFRLASATLTALLNDRHSWDWRQVFHDSSGTDSIVRPYLEEFPTAEAEARDVPLEPWDWGQSEAHYWALLRNGDPAAIMSAQGTVHLRNGVRDVAHAYAARGRNIHRVAGDLILSHLT